MAAESSTPSTLPRAGIPQSTTAKSNSVEQRAVKASTPRGPSVHQIYTLPVPIRTYPLPTFYPNNPLSLFHVLYTWLSQVIFPPVAEPSIVFPGVWSRETRSVHVTDVKSIRALWEQGFFGKGSFSRSEPNWLKREQARKGRHGDHVAEEFTNKRREERKLMKWDRARKEQEAIRKTRRDEAWVAPVGPLELLALPNSLADMTSDEDSTSSSCSLGQGSTTSSPTSEQDSSPEPSPGKTPKQPNGILSKAPTTHANGFLPLDNDLASSPAAFPPPTLITDTATTSNPSDNNQQATKRRKSVRFSPKVQSATFMLSDPPSPGHSLLTNGKLTDRPAANGSALLSGSPEVPPSDLSLDKGVAGTSASDGDIVDREHLQLMPEEAFYLTYALGALSVQDPATQKTLSVQDLFQLFRQHSYFPPRAAALQPDDPFMLQYAVYHHFRSLGWVVRPGIKFGVDWLLYHRGPVFSHAEFALIVLPAYTDPGWNGRQPPQRSWHWLHSVNRVQSTALKTLVMIHVDIPPSCDEQLDISATLKRYKIREFVLKRWLSNRNRD